MTSNYDNAAKSILSIILTHGREAFEEAKIHLEASHFVKSKYRMMWDSFQRLEDIDSSINVITVRKDLDIQKDRNGRALSLLFGNVSDYLAMIKMFIDGEIGDLYTFAKLLLDEYVVAEIDRVCDLVKQERTAGRKIRLLEESAPKWYISNPKSYQTIDAIVERMIREAEASGKIGRDIRNSLPMLSESLFMSPGNVTTIAGDTGSGKTSLALQLVYDIARQRTVLLDEDSGRPILDEMFQEQTRPRTILFLSMEMSKDEIVGKLFCNRFNMSFDEMKALPVDEFVKLAREMEKIMQEEMPNLVIVSGECSLADSKKHCLNVKRRFGHLDLVVYDHIGLLEDILTGHGDEHVKYGRATRYIKMKIAVSLDTHAVMLSQLRKPQIDRMGKEIHEPTISRLYNGSGTAQDSSNIIFTYREYSVEKRKTTIQVQGKLEQISTFFITRLKFAKSRFGSTDKATPVGFIPYIQRIVPLSTIARLDLLNSEDRDYRLSDKDFRHLDKL